MARSHGGIVLVCLALFSSLIAVESRSSGLTFPSNWLGDVSEYCRFPPLQRVPREEHLVRNHLYSIVFPQEKFQDYPFLGELHIRPTDSVFGHSCPSSTASPSIYLTFEESRLSFAASPRDDYSILSTMNSKELKLRVIDSRDLFISEVTLEVVNVHTHTKLASSFLNHRFALFELMNNETIDHYLYDHSTAQVRRLETPLPFSLHDKEGYVIDTSSASSIRVISSQKQKNEAVVKCYESYGSEPTEFRLRWNYTIPSAVAVQIAYKAGGKYLLVSATSENTRELRHKLMHRILEASSGNLFGQEDQSVARFSQLLIAARTGSSFFVAVSQEVQLYEVSDYTRSFKISPFVSFENDVGSLYVSASGYLHLSKMEWYGSKFYVVDRNGVSTQIHIDSQHKKYHSKTLTSTNHFLLLQYSDGEYALLRPSEHKMNPSTPSPSSSWQYLWTSPKSTSAPTQAITSSHHSLKQPVRWWSADNYYVVKLIAFVAILTFAVVWTLFSWALWKERRQQEETKQQQNEQQNDGGAEQILIEIKQDTSTSAESKEQEALLAQPSPPDYTVVDPVVTTTAE